MKITPVQIAAAIQTLSQAALAFEQVKALLEKPDLTPEDVKAQLDHTDATLDHLREDDAS